MSFSGSGKIVCGWVLVGIMPGRAGRQLEGVD
jgi:hypothetical protein